MLGIFCWPSPALAYLQNTSDPQLGASDKSLIDREVEFCMQSIGATSASLAMSYQGKVVYSKGYGFSDRRQRKVTSHRVAMRLASCSKPFTAAAIKTLIDQGLLKHDTPVFDYLGIAPSQDLADPRIREITIGHLLKHEGGWDRDKTFDPMYEIDRIKSEIGVSKVKKRHLVRYMWEQPLQFAPGTKVCYSNFGYLLLGLVIEKVTGKSYIKSIRELVTDPIDAGEIFLSSAVSQNRKSREVFYPAENQLNLQLRDSSSGLTADPTTLCHFMEAFWLNGRKRTERTGWSYYQLGTHPQCTTALMEQRQDGLSFAVLFNRRQEETYRADNDAIRERLNKTIDRLAGRWLDK